MSNTTDDILAAAPSALKLLGTALAATGVGGPAGVIVGGLGTVMEHFLGKPATPENIVAAISDPAMQEKLLELQENNKTVLQQALIAKDIADRQAKMTEDANVLLDKQDARKRDVSLQTAGKYNRRADLMLFFAFASIISIVYLMMTKSIDGNTAVGGALIALLGAFAKDIGTAFDFEFGSSRASRDKDATIAQQAANAGQIDK